MNYDGYRRMPGRSYDASVFRILSFLATCRLENFIFDGITQINYISVDINGND